MYSTSDGDDGGGDVRKNEIEMCQQLDNPAISPSNQQRNTDKSKQVRINPNV